MRSLFRLAQSTMGMSEATWARHANPWSVYSRMTLLPLLTIAVWSRAWIGPWALLYIGLCLAWAWINPRLFSAPRRTDTWASEGTFGERLFMADATVARHHRLAVALLTGANALGFAVLVWGLIVLDPWITLWGLTTTMGAKLWTFDRMVWLYRDHHRSAPMEAPTDGRTDQHPS